MSRLSYPSNHAVAPATLEAIRSRHPLALQAVAYAPGRYEIGHGCRWGPYPGLLISPVQAEDLFRSDIAYVEGRIRTWFSCPMRDGAYQALLSYFFDTGTGGTHVEDVVNLFENGGEKRFFRTLPGAFNMSRFGPRIGRAARFFECKHSLE